MSEIGMYVATGIACLSLAMQVLEKVFGGGNALANRFHALETKTTADVHALQRETTEAIAKLRTDLNDRVDQYEDNYSVGLDAIKANIQTLREGLLEFRAKMAEDYVPKGGLDDIKADMRRGFGDINERMGQLQDLIMWAAPDVPGRPPPRKTPQ